MSSYELIHTIVNEGIVLYRLDTSRSLQLHALNGLEHIYHSLHTESLDAVTKGAEDAGGAQALPEGKRAHYASNCV